MTRICSPKLTHCSVRESRLARANVIHHFSVTAVKRPSEGVAFDGHVGADSTNFFFLSIMYSLTWPCDPVVLRHPDARDAGAAMYLFDPLKQALVRRLEFDAKLDMCG